MSSHRSTQPISSQPQTDEAPRSGSDAMGTVSERLARLRHGLIGWLDLQAKEELRLLQTLGTSSAEAVEIEAYTLLLELHNEPQQALLALQRCSELMSLAQGLKKPLCEAAVWRVMQTLQSFLMLHPAALHSVGMAARLYAECGEPELEQMMLESRHYVLFHAQMYEELYRSCQAQLSLPGNRERSFGYRLLSGAAGAAYNMGIRCPDAQARQTWWRESLQLHREALALSRQQGQRMMEAISLLNMCVVLASLGEVEEARSALRGVDALPQVDQGRPGWMAWYRLAVALIQVHNDSASAGAATAAWAGLLEITRSLQDGGLNHAAAAEVALRTVRILGQERGHLQDALWAADTLLEQQVRSMRGLAQNMSDTLSAVIERPRLMQEKERLAEHGFALESSLAQRNAELSSALAKVQAEASIRAAAEAALKRAHDELEAQVQQRTAELEQAMRALMKQEKQLALSRMVAGMAHEMNTPLGNARMAASAIQAQGESLSLSMAAGTVKRSQLSELIAGLHKGSSLMDRSLQRVAALVERFKSLDIQGTSESAQTFDLCALIQELSLSWQNQLKDGQILLQLELPQALEIYGHAHACVQVLQELFANSLSHGLAGQQEPPPRLRLALGMRPDLAQGQGRELIELSWHDNGAGVAAEHLTRVLEPFFSTRLGQSGAGLGLSMVHNLVVDLMEGQIQVISPDRPADRGTCVQLQWPRALPGPDTSLKDTLASTAARPGTSLNQS
ncbi:HAMP domain-containing histidine kinase [Paucibacter sp. DJ1R-11]|uniref:sensor histidine kinase n=1 Tax=Paucibacter sp. DJ1R-11 TaxID=2893556 RepID=UPI0021E4F251|nr:HAMP domain-containing sensor histidine kinase [Paucibacter sp. DJ1R-11]MCV2364089.1 HAMP domain-containing histidine kinase [Paucibacter sp. DJ1R-11]